MEIKDLLSKGVRVARPELTGERDNVFTGGGILEKSPNFYG